MDATLLQYDLGGRFGPDVQFFTEPEELVIFCTETTSNTLTNSLKKSKQYSI
jgi:hypothetical protein